MRRILVGSAVTMLVTASLMYLFDPVSGQRRRRSLRKSSVSVARRIGNGVVVAQLTRYGARRFNHLASRLRDAVA